MNPLTASEGDIAAAYRLILGRDPTPAEEAGQNGRDCNGLFLDLLFSPEFVERGLPAIRELLTQRFTDYYVPLLGRYHSVFARFRQGQRLTAKSSDNAEFVLVTYLMALKRLPDPIGCLHYFRLLEAGALDRPELTRIVEESAEGSVIRERPTLEQIEITDYFDQSEFPEANKIAKSVQLLIVSGPPRSGTTALTALLNADPRICVTNESRVFSIPDQITRVTLLGELSMSRTGVFEVVSEILDQHSANAIRNTLARLRKCEVILDRSQKQAYRRARVGMVPLLVGDKNPGYLSDLPEKTEKISGAFPDAKWILIFRNPEWAFTSQSRLRFVSSKAESTAILRRSLESACSLTRNLGPAQCFVTTHDRLFSAASYGQEVARLAAFLKLPDHDAFSSFVAKQLQNPEKFSVAEQTTPTHTSLREVDAFFADQPDSPVLGQLVRELGLWTDAPAGSARL